MARQPAGVQPVNIEPTGDRDHGRDIIEGEPSIKKRRPHGPVEKAGVEMMVAEMLRELSAQCPLAGGRGAVDGDDHLSNRRRRLDAGAERRHQLAELGKARGYGGRVVDRHRLL